MIFLVCACTWLLKWCSLPRLLKNILIASLYGGCNYVLAVSTTFADGGGTIPFVNQRHKWLVSLEWANAAFSCTESEQLAYHCLSIVGEMEDIERKHIALRTNRRKCLVQRPLISLAIFSSQAQCIQRALMIVSKCYIPTRCRKLKFLIKHHLPFLREPCSKTDGWSISASIQGNIRYLCIHLLKLQIQV